MQIFTPLSGINQQRKYILEKRKVITWSENTTNLVGHLTQQTATLLQLLSCKQAEIQPQCASG